MEELGFRFEGLGNPIRKKRTQCSRRPRPESQPVSNNHEVPTLSSTPSLDELRAGSSDENNGSDHDSRSKELSLSHCESKFPGTSEFNGENSVRKGKKVNVGIDELYVNSEFKDCLEQGQTSTHHRRSSEGVLAPANCKSTSRSEESLESQKTMDLNNGKNGESLGQLSNNKIKKVKLKVGGVTRTFDANSSLKTSHGSDAAIHGQLIQKDNSHDSCLPSSAKKGRLQGIPWKDFSKGGFSLGREESSVGKRNRKNQSGRQGDKTDTVHKSRRGPKKRVINGFRDDVNDDDDDEIRYLEKLKNAKFSIVYDDEESGKKHRRLSKISGNIPQNVEGCSPSQSGKDGKRRSPSEDIDCDYEDEVVANGEVEVRKKKTARKDTCDSVVEPRREMTLTTRQRALQLGCDPSSPNGTGVEFPNGLPPAPSKKQKEKLSEVDQQLKKAEAAERRRIHNEKAARESEAEAIRKILGQDSSRKKREEKKKKHDEDMARAKAADELLRASNSIRLVMGPNGNTVTFPNDVGMPSIFNSKPCSYPPPREICAGPSCKNPCKYCDSKTKLPLCSLQCYKAIQGNVQSETTTTC